MRIVLEQVTVRAGDQILLQDVNLELPPGSVTLVAGATGSGRSTLLKTAAGLVAPAAGRVLSAADDNPQGTVGTGFVFQDAALWANTSLRGNLDLPLRARRPGLPVAVQRDKVMAALDELGWQPDLSLRPAALSEGERKLLGFARAVIPDPAALLLDEPLAGLDAHWRRSLVAALARRRDAGVLVAVAGHEPELAGLADRLVLLDGGRLVAAGPRDTLLADPPAPARDLLARLALLPAHP